MTTNVKVASDIQELSPGRLVEMYQLDLTGIGGDTILYFTPVTKDNNTPIVFGGLTYIPIHMKTEGWEVSGDGQLPRPKITVSNVLLYFLRYVIDYQDMVGAEFKRIRTFKKYLDGESEADPTATFPYDIFVIERKTAEDKFTIQFELSAYMDFEGIQLPKRQILRDTCLHNYRIYVDGSFSYDDATCPYIKENSGSPSYFIKNGNYTTTASEDVCGRRLGDCELRYACNRLSGGETITIHQTAPVAPVDGDYWLQIVIIPNILWQWQDAISDWVQVKPQPLPTRSYPSVGKLRV